ncbi:MAG: nucleotidyltransferase domain-containing protein [Nanoarchaeota archaeon]
MIQNYNRYKILNLFFKFPRKNFQLREISRLAKIALPSTKKYVEELVKDQLILENKETLYKSYNANLENNDFRLYKKISTLIKLKDLIYEIENKMNPDVVVLYGSASNGEDVEDSDIDLFIIGREKPINLARFEKELNRKIHLIFENDLKKVSKEFLNNLINGIVLYGYLKVF